MPPRIPAEEGAQGLPDFSVGSLPHAVGRCRACAFVGSPAGCRNGALCAFCHVLDGHGAVAMLRPSKGKRRRTRKAHASMRAAVDGDPSALT